MVYDYGKLYSNDERSAVKIYRRSRITYGIVIILVIILGLCSRRYSNIFPDWIGEYAGDTLWALMIFLSTGFIFRAWPTLKAGIISLSFCFLIEISQLYHSPWIDSIRKTTLGSLILGFGFLWTDILCYIIGITIGFLLEKLLLERIGI